MGPGYFPDAFFAAAPGLGILNHRIDFDLQKISPVGHVLGDERQVACLDEMPAES